MSEEIKGVIVVTHGTVVRVAGKGWTVHADGQLDITVPGYSDPERAQTVASFAPGWSAVALDDAATFSSDVRKPDGAS